MFVEVRNKTRHEELLLPPAILVEDDYCYVELDERSARVVEELEGDGPGVMVNVGPVDLYYHRGALSYRNGKTYLRWDPTTVRD